MTQENEQETVQEVQEVAKDQESINSDGELIAESKKYRSRAQKAEAKIAEMEKNIEANRTKQLEEQNEWKTLAEERKGMIDELTPIVDKYKADEAKFTEELLSDFSEDDRETFKELPLNQLRAVHTKLISKQKVPNVDTSPAGEYQGYNSLIDAAKDVRKGILDKKSYAKIKESFTSRINRA